MSTVIAAASHIPDLYLSSLPDDLRADFQTALHRVGLDSEIALLRVQIQKLMKHDPDNLKLMLRIVHLIERLTKCNLQIKKDNAPPGPGPADSPEPTTPASVSEISPETTPVDPAAAPESSPGTLPPTAAVPQHRTWSSSSVAHKAPASRLPASAHFLFQKKKHKKR
jgi:hypothetical protein